MNLQRTLTIGGQRVEPGVKIPFSSNREQVRFAVASVCDSIDPPRWHGEVSLHGRTILTSESVDDDERAGRAAENALTEKLVRLLASD